MIMQSYEKHRQLCISKKALNKSLVGIFCDFKWNC